MDYLNDPESEIYKKALSRTNDIEKQLNVSKINCLNNKCFVLGSIEDILKHLNFHGRNLVHAFFKYTTNKCDNCGIFKSKLVQLERAHCNKENCDRSSLLYLAIKEHYNNEKVPIYVKDILKTFIKLHNKIPLFILCKKCHKEYDKIKKL